MRNERNPKNPFEEEAPAHYPVRFLQTIDAPGRMDKVKLFNAHELRLVIELPGVQKAVRLAAERRLRKMEQGK